MYTFPPRREKHCFIALFQETLEKNWFEIKHTAALEGDNYSMMSSGSVICPCLEELFMYTGTRVLTCLALSSEHRAEFFGVVWKSVLSFNFEARQVFKAVKRERELS